MDVSEPASAATVARCAGPADSDAQQLEYFALARGHDARAPWEPAHDVRRPTPVRHLLGPTAGLLLLIAIASGCDGDDLASSTVHDTTVSPGAPSSAQPTAPEPTTTTPPEPARLRGTIVLGEWHTAQSIPDEIPFGAGAHAVVEIWRGPYMVADASSELIASVRVDDVDGFPIAFEFDGPIPIESPVPGVDPEFEYLPRAIVRLGDVGDRSDIDYLFKDYRLTIDDPSEPLVIEVTAFGDCDGEVDGYFCVAAE